jgi:hypothetical protein
VIVPEIAAAPAFVAVNAGTFPVPLAAIPMPVLLLVHVYVAPPGVLVKTVAGIFPPLQTVTLGGTVTVGFGLITTVTVEDAVHPPELATTVYVPAARSETPAMLGFCSAEENEFGPVQL